MGILNPKPPKPKGDDLNSKTPESPKILKPYNYSPKTLKPYIYSPKTLKPYNYSPKTLKPYNYSPKTLKPYNYSPKTLKPYNYSPKTLKPYNYSPKTLKPYNYSPKTPKLLKPKGDGPGRGSRSRSDCLSRPLATKCSLEAWEFLGVLGFFSIFLKLQWCLLRFLGVFRGFRVLGL